MRKTDVLTLLDGLPDGIDAEELMYRISVLAKVEAAEQQYERGD